VASNLSLRILSSLLLIPVVFGAIYAGGWIFGICVAVAFGISCGEWHGITSKTKHPYLYLVAGLIYFSVSFALFALLRAEDENGLYLVFTLMLCVWASDTGAYILGRMIGGPKMAPTISPKKTWAGMAGAVLGPAVAFTACLIAAPALAEFIPNKIDVRNKWPILLFYGGLVGYVGQAGDLLVSLMKRKAGVKDSGALIPGHGGILDRIDSLLLIVPVFVAICYYGF
jgi:phosphatidate cytidylyltransferase